MLQPNREVVTMERAILVVSIDETSKFYNFVDNMANNKIRVGYVKLKTGVRKKFKYVTCERVGDKKIHYIQIGMCDDDPR